MALHIVNDVNKKQFQSMNLHYFKLNVYQSHNNIGS